MLRKNEAVFLFPGVLSNGASFQALGFDTDACMAYTAYSRDGFDVERIVKEVAIMVVAELRKAVPVTLVGASLGGVLIPFIVEKVREIAPELLLDQLRCVVIDSPFGAETMIAMGCNSVVGRVICSPLGQLLRPLAHVKVGPKDEYIEVPDADMMREIAGEAMSANAWCAYVKRRAIAELSGHSGKQWLEQLRWMVRTARDGSLYRVCRSLQDIDATYLACTSMGNNVVQQPSSRLRWMGAVPGMRLVVAEAVHCGFVQQAVSFRKALAEILG